MRELLEEALRGLARTGRVLVFWIILCLLARLIFGPPTAADMAIFLFAAFVAEWALARRPVRTSSPARR